MHNFNTNTANCEAETTNSTHEDRVAFFLLAAAICIFAASVIFCEVI